MLYYNFFLSDIDVWVLELDYLEVFVEWWDFDVDKLFFIGVFKYGK